ncbi:MAG: FtsX-like permease family protein, partial [Thermoplasmata archaeon]
RISENTTEGTFLNESLKRIQPREVKRSSIERAQEASEMLTQFLTIFGSFSIIAGIMLIVNIFVMLGEERKQELGMARAVGMQRSHLIEVFVLEGSIYSVFSAIIGTIAGLGVAGALIWGINNIFNVEGFSGIPFYFDNISLIKAFCYGFVITVITIFVSSYKISRMNIIRAIRDIEEPVLSGLTLKMGLFGIALVVLSTISFFFGFSNYIVRLVAPSTFIIGAGILSRKFLKEEIAFTALSVGVIAYNFWSIKAFFSKAPQDQQDYLFIISGVLLVISVVLIVMYNSRYVVSALSFTLGRIKSLKPIVKTSTSHPLNQKFRTGMTVAMFALVIYVVVMLSVFSYIFTSDTDRFVRQQGGGYDIVAETRPVASLEQATYTLNNTTYTVNSQTFTEKVAYSDSLRMQRVQAWKAYEPNETNVSNMKQLVYGASIVGFEHPFAQRNEFSFSQIAPEYAHLSAQDIWYLVENSSDLCIVNTGFLMTTIPQDGSSQQPTVNVGDTVVVSTGIPQQPYRKFKIVAVMEQMWLSGLFINDSLMTSSFLLQDQSMGRTMHLVKVAEGYDPETVTYELEKDYRKVGMNSVALRATLLTIIEMINNIFLLFKVFLSLGLVVGIAGLGVITIRAVYERKNEIGIMRAIGYRKSAILKSFLTEVLFIATLGALIGLGVGIPVSWEIFNISVENTGSTDLTFKVPWTDIGIIIGIAYLCSLLATFTTAKRASELEITEALRKIE